MMGDKDSLPPSGEIHLNSVWADSVSLCWGSPGDLDGPNKFRVTWEGDGTVHSKTIHANHYEIKQLSPGTKYDITVVAVGDNSKQSFSASVNTAIGLPEDFICDSSEATTAKLRWTKPQRMDPSAYKFRVTSYIADEEAESVTLGSNYETCTLTDLVPATKYSVSITTVLGNGRQSEPKSLVFHTKPSEPEGLKVESVGATSITLQWDDPQNHDDMPHSFKLTWSDDTDTTDSLETTDREANVDGLTPGTEYTLTVSTIVFLNDSKLESVPVQVKQQTCISVKSVLEQLGLQHFLKQKLSLRSVLELNKNMVEDKTAENVGSLAWHFLRKIMMVNITARSTEHEDLSRVTSKEQINPLDLITAVFLCSDAFLQQEIALKMSLCQFAIPFLLPNYDTQQCTFMLWAMRDIVKNFKSHSLKGGFEESSIVLTEMPMVSFVRLGKSSLSKSHFLNKLLSNNQQHHDTFVHRDMVNGHVQRKISNGLVELSWYLPSGKEKNDIFKEPMAVANLRGDAKSFETQFAFLCQTSTAVFCFCDDLDIHQEFLNSLQFKSKLFLVCPSQGGLARTKDIQTKFPLKPYTSLLVKDKTMNDAEFVRQLRQTVAQAVKDSQKTCIEAMSAIAPDLGIIVDEDKPSCQCAKERADLITKRITDIPTFKSSELPLQGDLWRKLSKLEKEECRLKHAGKKSIEHYKSEVSAQIQELRNDQWKSGITRAALLFHSGLCSSQEERRYFLKWMKINLDNLTRKNVSQLEELYKDECENPTKDQKSADLEKKIASSSLGIEHFFREIGQLYESSLHQNDLKNLPKVCAELVLDGVPLELIDGDASNIPLQFIGDVIKELDHLTKPNNKIRVVTVLGVQSTGKSTLLNTMFGVQFAVSSGRCTRGAFMLLINVAEELKKELRCDFIMVIDTEGLKSPTLAHLANSYEHDNELATMVVGLSDLTLVNIAMENATDMKDTLQIVVHAFLRMKEVGKRPCCHFVHQNVSDIAAHEKTSWDRKHLLKDLNEMTKAAAKMENKDNNQKFSDILEYNPEKNNWYIPGLWHGIPPMAPVNTGYSNGVHDLKQGILKHFKAAKGPAHKFMEFEEWARSLWRAVKYENFIFSFRNSLVAEAYTKLCTEFHTWEWNFKKEVNKWFRSSETKISNSTVPSEDPVNIDALLMDLKSEAIAMIAKEAEILQDKIEQYFEREDDCVNLVEKHKADFLTSAMSLKIETELNIKSKLESVVEIQRSRTKLDNIRQKQRNIMKERVLELIDVCRSKTGKLSESELEEYFQTMWDKTVKESSFYAMPRQDVAREILNLLRSNLEMQGGAVREMFASIDRLDECGKEPFVTKSERNIGVKQSPEHDNTRAVHEASTMIISHCMRFIREKTSAPSDYNSIDVQELLCRIDQSLECESQLYISPKHAASLKIHICGNAAREFQQMHDAFIVKNDPRKTLEKFRSQWLSDFKDFYYQRDQCNTKADTFVNSCLAPAVMEYIQKSLGPDIVEEMLTGRRGMEFSTRSFFQYSFLKELLQGEDLANIFQYIESYEECVTRWISERIIKHFSEEDRLAKLETQHLNKVVSKIKNALASAQTKMENAQSSGQGAIKTFMTHLSTNLRKDLIIPGDALDATLFLNNSNPVEFAECLKSSIDKMQETLQLQLHTGGNVRVKLSRMSMPQEELFSRVFGCGKSCPFCSAPCEAGGKYHTEHFASIHRPQGFAKYRWNYNGKLSCDICSTSVVSGLSFYCKETGYYWYPYSQYRNIYPDWRIQPDPSIQASDFWKYIFVKYNTKFAERYNAYPADIPANWYYITLQQAQRSLEETFSMKSQPNKS